MQARLKKDTTVKGIRTFILPKGYLVTVLEWGNKEAQCICPAGTVWIPVKNLKQIPL